MSWTFNIITTIFSITLLSRTLDACTAFQLQSQEGASIYCRSMEFGYDLQSKLLIVPRGMDYVGTAPDNQKGMTWKSKYGFVGLNQSISPTFVVDGMNERGLVVGVLYLPRFAEYEKPDIKRKDKTLGAWELATYLLGTCGSLDEVKSALKQVLVAEQSIPEINRSLPLHFYVGDNQGNVLIVEYLKGQRHEYDNPVGVLTNAPSFDWHMNNLSNFVNLSPTNVPAINLKKGKIQGVGQGSGLLGIPGDYTPPSRFVRATLFSQWATLQKSAVETVRLGFHILNTFDIFEGIIRSDNSAAEVKNNTSNMKEVETTQWIVVHDRTNFKTYFRGYDSLQIQMVDFRKLNFTQPGFQQIDIQSDFIAEDVTNKVKDMKLPRSKDV